jgi:NAD(P)-dependent dehydrogenase (short-subunit alcohol dehydrogenase family)
MQGKTALITGGSKGIGYGVAETLIAAGMNVVITARSEDQVKDAAARLTDKGSGKALGVACDVRDFAAQQAVVKETLDAFGSLDVLVANAGVGAFAPIEDMDIDDWHKVIDTNLTGAFYSVKACVDALKASEGYVITISSLAGRNFFAGGAAYNASKFGLTGFTEAIMLDLRKHAIKVSTIMPGSVATYFNDHEPNDADAWKIQSEDIGKLVYDLLTMHPRTLPSRIEVRPSIPPSAR